MLADCRETAIENLRNVLFRGGPLRCGLGLALFFEPIAHLGIREQSHQFLDLLWCRLLARRWLRGRLCRCETAARQYGCENYRSKYDRGHSSGGSNDPFALKHRIVSLIGFLSRVTIRLYRQFWRYPALVIYFRHARHPADSRCLVGCCALPPKGQARATDPIVMNSRRLMAAPRSRLARRRRWLPDRHRKAQLLGLSSALFAQLAITVSGTMSGSR